MAEVLTRHGRTERVTRALERVQAARARVAEVEGALLHFWLLPAREDLRAVRRRVHRLRREVRTLEAEISALERLVEERR